MAASGDRAFATGGAFFTRLWRSGTSKVGLKMAFSHALALGMPQTKTKTERTIHGIHASHASPGVGRFTAAPTERNPGAPADLASDSRSPGKRHSVLGCHTFNNRYVARIEHAAAMMSTSEGPKKFETTNCGMAKESPATRHAGQTPSMPRKPDIAHTSQNGTRTEKSGSCRPTMADSRLSFRPVTLASVMMGVPRAP